MTIKTLSAYLYTPTLSPPLISASQSYHLFLPLHLSFPPFLTFVLQISPSNLWTPSSGQFPLLALCTSYSSEPWAVVVLYVGLQLYRCCGVAWSNFGGAIAHLRIPLGQPLHAGPFTTQWRRKNKLFSVVHISTPSSLKPNAWSSKKFRSLFCSSDRADLNVFCAFLFS